MDLSTLICGLDAAGPEDQKRKLEALRFAHSNLLAIEPELSFGDFVRETPAAVSGQRLGPVGEDFYLTALLSCVARDRPDFDPVVAAILNRIVLQLNFQTRFIGTRGFPEVLILDGPAELFGPAMANGNVVIGFHMDPDPMTRPAPKWAECAHIEYSPNMLWRVASDIGLVMRDLDRTRIGCLALVLPAPNAGPKINLAERYAPFADSLQDDGFFVLAGPSATVLGALAEIELSQPDARLVSRLYRAGSGEIRAILVASGLSHVPQLELENV